MRAWREVTMFRSKIFRLILDPNRTEFCRKNLLYRIWTSKPKLITAVKHLGSIAIGKPEQQVHKAALRQEETKNKTCRDHSIMTCSCHIYMCYFFARGDTYIQ